MKKINQKQLAFYKLYETHKRGKGEWVKAWEFVGEIFVKELGKWCLMSYNTPANGLKVFFQNPGLLERRKFRGKTGALYYEYRIAANPSVDKIKDDALRSFYGQITGKRIPSMVVINQAQADKLFSEL